MLRGAQTGKNSGLCAPVVERFEILGDPQSDPFGLAVGIVEFYGFNASTDGVLTNLEIVVRLRLTHNFFKWLALHTDDFLHFEVLNLVAHDFIEVAMRVSALVTG